MRRGLSVLLAIVLMMCLLPASAMASGGAGEAIEVTPREISVSLDGDRAEVSVQASGPSCGSYRLLVAAYGGDGRMLRAGASSIQFSQSTQTFSVGLEGCAEAVEYRAFFLAGDDSFRPVSQAIRTADRGTITPLARVHTAAELAAVDGVEPYSEHWLDDREITADLSGALGLAYSLTISDQTSFTAPPAGYDPEELIAWGKDPGLGVAVLHDHGFTGRGAVIAYVDQPIPTPYHEQYSGANLHYTNTAERSDNSMHGPAVLSLLAGKDTGTAPEAEVYYYAHAAWMADQSTHADCLYRIIEQNQSLPEGEKITMAAFSDNIDETEANADAFRAAVEACEEAGIMVWFCEEYGAAAFLPMSDRGNPENLTWDSWVTPGQPAPLVYVPTGSRTTAATMDGADYIYWASGGLSWAMPYMLGLYAIAAEIDPGLTQEQLRALVVETAYENSAGMKIVNPVSFIAAALDGVGRGAEADALRADAAARESYLYAVMNTSAMSEADLEAVAGYLSTVTDAQVLVADASGFADGPALYEALQADAASRGGTVAGVQIFGTASMVPAFPISYRVQMASGVDEGGMLLTDLFYGNFENQAEDLTSSYNVLDHFAEGWDIDLVPQRPVARLPLERGAYTAFFEKYGAFAEETGLTRQTLVNFSNPIFASTRHTDDMGAFLNRMHGEFRLLDANYRLYGNQKGDYPVTTEVLGDFTAENLSAENSAGIAEFLINSHGQRDNIDRCYYADGEEIRESLVSSATIDSVLGGNPYYLDCWTCNNGYGMEDNLTTAALNGRCVGVFSATSTLSNNGVNCAASLDEMRKSNFYYFYYSYLKALYEGQSRGQAFYAAQRAYASALIADSANSIRGDGNYQFNLYNLLSYENFGVLEPNAAAVSLYDNSGFIGRAPDIPQTPGGGGESGEDGRPERDPLTSGFPMGEAWEVPYLLQEEPSELYTIHGLTARRLSNGYVRITADYEGAAGMYIDAFNPPEGDVFMLYGGEVSGQRETFSFDLSPEELKAVEEVTILFYGEAAERYYLSFLTADVWEEAVARSILFALDGSGAPLVSYVDMDGAPEGAALAHLFISSEEHGTAWLGGYSAENTWAQMYGWALEAGTYSGAYVRYLNGQEEEIDGGYSSDVSVIVEPSQEQIACTDAFYSRSGGGYTVTITGLIPYTCRYTIELYDSDGQMFDRWNDYADETGTIRMETAASSFPDGEVQCIIRGNGDFRVSPDGKQLTCQAYQPAGPFTISDARNVAFTTSDELQQSGSVTVHGCTSQPLEDGGVRVTLTFSAPAGMDTYIFDSPDGKTYGMWGPQTIEGMNTLTFDLTAEQRETISLMVVNIFRSDSDRFFVHMRPEDL